MRISGFSFVRNGVSLYYPIREAVASVLPLVDEFVVAVGQGDPGDTTREVLASLDSPKLRIVDTIWDIDRFPGGTENAHQTDIAKSHCTGDWLFYLQADEVVHERDLPTIRRRCEQLLDDREVEGLLFGYLHFWGDYDHYQRSHGWYKREIRIVRNDPEIHSWESAQSFRRIPDFDGHSYRQREGTHKLKVAPVEATIFHYGWVRPPRLMRTKSRALDTVHKGTAAAEEIYRHLPSDFDYGDLRRLARFTGTHPAVMREFIARFDWDAALREFATNPTDRPLHKHERMKYRVLTWIEQHLAGGRELGGFRNYELLRR